MVRLAQPPTRTGSVRSTPWTWRRRSSAVISSAPASIRPGAEQGELEAVDERCGLVGRRGRVTEPVERARGLVGGERGQHGQTECAADLLSGIDQARGDARLARVDRGSGEQGHRHERQADSDRREHEAGKQVGHVGAVDRDLGEQQHPDRGHDHPGQRHGA